MSHTVRFKLTNKQSEAILHVINLLNPGQDKPVSIDEFAKMCIIQATREILLSLKEGEKNGSQASQTEQVAGAQNTQGNVPGGELAQVQDTVHSGSTMGNNIGTQPG